MIVTGCLPGCDWNKPWASDEYPEKKPPSMIPLRSSGYFHLYHATCPPSSPPSCPTSQVLRPSSRAAIPPASLPYKYSLASGSSSGALVLIRDQKRISAALAVDNNALASRAPVELHSSCRSAATEKNERPKYRITDTILASQESRWK